RGYLNNQELTNEKFTKNPFQPGERMYHTGDLARWLPDGNIEYLGRMDHQVKIRGYRIELGEIENALLQNELIHSVVVVVNKHTNGDTTPVAYYVADNELKTAELRSFLSQSLPEFMIPSRFVNIPTLPLTTSGKIDRKALPNPDVAGFSTGINYVAPRNSIEKTLTGIWEDVLGIERIGIYDNFFELGGHSLKA
ncbi:MAG: non-ribosomal peptide synthetase, partial [bacterium]|nr:non-ribosomal peptide synthetase [bacterium]